MRSSRLMSVIEPMNSRATSGASDASSGLTSTVMIGEPDPARWVTRPWPISPPAPVIKTTGLRIHLRHAAFPALQPFLPIPPFLPLQPIPPFPALRRQQHVDRGVDHDHDHEPSNRAER